MLEIGIIISLQITAIFCVFAEGNLLYKFRGVFGWLMDKGQVHPKISVFIQKPLWDCLPCMASTWGSLLMWLEFDGWSIWHLLLISGLNFVIDKLFIEHEHPTA